MGNLNRHEPIPPIHTYIHTYMHTSIYIFIKILFSQLMYIQRYSLHFGWWQYSGSSGVEPVLPLLTAHMVATEADCDMIWDGV